MIKFFRRIRQRLLSENRFSKYLIYAIGEIILVVIGILIAIQLNEWRNDTLNAKQKQNVLKSLQAEFNANIAQLDSVVFYAKKIKNTYPRVMELIRKDTIGLDNEVYIKSYQNLGWTWTFNPINGALRSAISSGEIHLINNDRLIELLFSWEDVVKDSEEEASRLRNYQMATIAFRQKHIRTPDAWVQNTPGLMGSNYASDYKSLFKDVQFEDYASSSFLWAFEYINELDVIRTNNTEILKLIDRELKE
ncbi:DUF6090 family protein [Flagellimonas sp.]|uniref:DUF6090 family protein n=1 Tax=Flagellimonas sp. TaxID=2058762 RepID=UPI003B50EAB6